MSSRRSVRQLLVAVILGVLVGGGLMAVTPAGAEVSNAVATSWKKIWKKNLKPLADKRYYTKAQGDAKYQPKGSYETAGSGYAKTETYSKAEADAKYAAAGSGYTKAESDAKYAPYPAVIRGTLAIGGQSAATNQYFSQGLSFGARFASAPVGHYIKLGAALPPGCLGTPQLPDAQPGNLCVFETYVGGPVGTNRDTCAATGPACFGKADPWGAAVFLYSNGTGQVETYLTWAARPPVAGLAARNAAVPDAVEVTGTSPSGR